MFRRVCLGLALLGIVPAASCFVENVSGRYCTSDTQCTEAVFTKCDTVHKTCVPSTFDFDLGTGGMPDLAVVGCASSATCPVEMPVCSAAQVCSPCGTPGASNDCSANHATTPLCGPNGGCVECLTKDNCDMIHKTCSGAPSYACVACVDNSDCTSGLCTAGACAEETTLLYVNNATGGGCSDTGAGSISMPFCTVQKGMNAGAMSGKTVVVFTGTYTENLQAVTTLNANNDYVATVVGIGNPLVKAAAGGAAVLTVGGTAGKQVTASFDGFTFDGSTIADGSDGVDCSGNTGNAYGKTLLTLTRSTVKGASGIGVSAAAKCSLTFDADVVSGNKAGGIKVDTTDLNFTNLLVYNNGSSSSAFGGILFNSAGETNKTTMANLTVVNNTALATAGTAGIYCLVAPSSLLNSFALGNAGPPPPEMSLGCMAAFSAYIGAAGSNNENIPATGCALSDLVINPAMNDFHPKKGGAKPCTLVDQGTNATNLNHDLDGKPRPVPASGTDDIGCYEAQ